MSGPVDYGNYTELPITLIKEGSPMPFVKIHQTILDSSIWLEPHPTRLLWITMLAMANEFGIVEASPSGLAARARITRDEMLVGVECLSSPDPDSKSQEYEGRRIEIVPGGWLVLNHMEYRDRRTTQQILTAERVRRHKERKAKQAKSGEIKEPLLLTETSQVTVDNATSPSEADSAEAYTETEKEKNKDMHFFENNSLNKNEDYRPNENIQKPEPGKSQSPKIKRVRRATNNVNKTNFDSLSVSLFEKFWDFYPKRDGKKLLKQAAIRKFMGLKSSDQELAVVAAENFGKRKSVLKGFGIKDAVRFLETADGDQVWRDFIEPESVELDALAEKNQRAVEEALAMSREG